MPEPPIPRTGSFPRIRPAGTTRLGALGAGTIRTRRSAHYSSS